MIIDKRRGEEGSEMALTGVFLFFSYTGVPLVNLLFKTITWFKFLKYLNDSGMQLCGPGHLK